MLGGSIIEIPIKLTLLNDLLNLINHLLNDLLNLINHLLNALLNLLFNLLSLLLKIGSCKGRGHFSFSQS